MNMKKRDKFNEKAWYRVLKVLYVFSFITVYILATSVVLLDTDWRVLDYDQYEITCSDTWQESDTSDVRFLSEDVNVTISTVYFDEGVFQYQDYFEASDKEYYSTADALVSIVGECVSVKDEMSMQLVFYTQWIFELIGTDSDMFDSAIDTIKELEGDSLEFYHLDFSRQLFNVEQKYVYFPFVLPIIFITLICVFIWESTRRVFYYIVLGSFLFKDYTKSFKWIKKITSKFLK
jgi:hypothetical protein